MDEPRFRFGVQLSPVASLDELVALALRAEALGYDVVTVPDHAGTELAPFPALTVLAAATERIRLGTLLLNSDLRHPLMTAHEAATLQVFSRGRFELGIGAGWVQSDYNRMGAKFIPWQDRVGRLAEAVEIYTKYFQGNAFSYVGRYYTVRDVQPLPLPPGTQRPPLLIGGGGDDVMGIAGLHADIVSLFFNAETGDFWFEDITRDLFRRKTEVLEYYGGRRVDSIERNVLLRTVEVTAHRKKAVMRWADEFGTLPLEILQVPLCLLGTIDEIVRDVERHRASDAVSYFTVRAEDMETFAPVVERLSGS